MIEGSFSSNRKFPVPTLAEKNRNPLNMRPLGGTQKWQGQVGIDRNSVTGAFVVFESNVMGIRAAVINLRTYVLHYGVRTIADAIYKWAPPPAGGLTGTAGSAVNGVDQNHTEAYIESVCKFAGVDRNFDLTPLAMPNAPSAYWAGKFAQVLLGMNRVEAGTFTVTIEEVREGISKALNLPAGYIRQDTGNVVREHMAQSETLKINTQGQLANVAATGTAAVTAFSAISDWKVAAIVAGVILVAGAATAFYFWRLRKDRNMMHEADIA